MSEPDKVICPFCRAEFPTSEVGRQLCGGPFLDRDHPSSVRPIFLPGHLTDDERERELASARARYRRGGEAQLHPEGGSGP